MKFSLAAVITLLGQTAAAESLPRWEFGLAGSAAEFNAYRGSSSSEQLAFAFPFFIYRSDRLKIGEGGARSDLFRSEDDRLNVSLSSGVPASNAQLAARAGMPRLETTLEIGPSYEHRFWKTEGGKELWLKIPLRAAFSFDDLSINSHGWLSTPALEYSWAINKLKFTVAGGAQFGSEKYHAYFYSVAPEYATPTRPEYQAGGGYAGVRLTGVVRQRWDKYVLGAYLRYDSLKNAVFEESALMEQDHYAAAGIFFGWLFYQSEERTTD